MLKIDCILFGSFFTSEFESRENYRTSDWSSAASFWDFSQIWGFFFSIWDKKFALGKFPKWQNLGIFGLFGNFNFFKLIFVALLALVACWDASLDSGMPLLAVNHQKKRTRVNWASITVRGAITRRLRPRWLNIYFLEIWRKTFFGEKFVNKNAIKHTLYPLKRDIFNSGIFFGIFSG